MQKFLISFLVIFSLQVSIIAQTIQSPSDFLGYGWKFNFESTLKKMSSDIKAVFMGEKVTQRTGIEQPRPAP